MQPEASFSTFSAQRALHQARRRRTAWSTSALLFLCLAAACVWQLWHFWRTAWHQPLELALALAGIHLPAEIFNPAGRLEAPMSGAAAGLNFLALLFAVCTVFLRRGHGTRPRLLITACGLACTALALAFAWAAQRDSQLNGRVRELADQGEYAQLQRFVRTRPQIPYAAYVGAQALVLAGKQGQLRQEYGDWLQRWGALAAEHGTLKPGLDPNLVRPWEGRSASPRVMRALEILAFGHGTSVFAQEYEAQVRRDAARAGVWGPWVGAVLAACPLLVLLSWQRAHRYARRVRRLRALALEHAQEQARFRQPGAVAAHRPQQELPPIEFSAPEAP